MRDLDETFARLPAYALRGRIRRHQLRMGLLQDLQLAHHRVVLGVGNLGCVKHVVQMLVVTKLLA